MSVSLSLIYLARLDVILVVLALMLFQFQYHFLQRLWFEFWISGDIEVDIVRAPGRVGCIRTSFLTVHFLHFPLCSSVMPILPRTPFTSLYVLVLLQSAYITELLLPCSHPPTICLQYRIVSLEKSSH
jgi:hypothetical protein